MRRILSVHRRIRECTTCSSGAGLCTRISRRRTHTSRLCLRRASVPSQVSRTIEGWQGRVHQPRHTVAVTLADECPKCAPPASCGDALGAPFVSSLLVTPAARRLTSTDRRRPLPPPIERNPGGLACPPKGTAQGPFRGLPLYR